MPYAPTPLTPAPFTPLQILPRLPTNKQLFPERPLSTERGSQYRNILKDPSKGHMRERVVDSEYLASKNT